MPTAKTNDRRRTIAVDGRMIYQDQCHGIARVTIELLKNLPTHRATDVIVLLNQGRTSRFDIGSLAEHVDIRYTSSAIGRPYDLRNLWGVLREIDAGVLYSPYHVLAPIMAPCKLVVGVHDCIIESDTRLAGGRIRAAGYRANTERVLRQATAVIVPSEATRGVLPSFYRHVPPTTVCPNGVDVAFWQPVREQIEAARAKLQLPDRFILHVGARRPHKNQQVLLQALAQIPGDVKLVMLGHRDPRTVDSIDRMADELRVADRLISVDDLDDFTLRGLYGAATVFAFPSLAEGFGLPPLEAMSAGVPVVASAIPAVAEVCREAAVLVSPFSPAHWAEAISAVLASATLREEMRDKGRIVAAAATWEAGARNMYELLSRTAGGPLED